MLLNKRIQLGPKLRIQLLDTSRFLYECILLTFAKLMLSCPLPFLFLFVVECFSQSSACLFSMNDKNNAHVDRSFSYMRLESEESMDPTDEDVRREKEKVSNMVSIEDSTFSAIVKVRKRKFS